MLNHNSTVWTGVLHRGRWRAHAEVDGCGLTAFGGVGVRISKLNVVFRTNHVTKSTIQERLRTTWPREGIGCVITFFKHRNGLKYAYRILVLNFGPVNALSRACAEVEWTPNHTTLEAGASKDTRTRLQTDSAPAKVIIM
jgi:hypothetical protein